MVEWVLIRMPRNNEYTEGVLFDKATNKRICDTLEDKVIDANASGKIDNGEVKVYGESAIPYGEYDIIVSYSPKFKKDMVEVLNVDSFTGIRMHYGRTALNSHGCPLVGEKEDDGVLSNIGMTDKLVKMLGKEKGKLYII
jgi:hypothetical protein